MDESIFDVGGPPSSPPIVHRRAIKMMKHVIDVIRKSMTEKASAPGGVRYSASLFD